MSDHFDFVLAGGGAAGLSLAYHLIHGGFERSRIAIVDLDEKGKNDRTWCFWIDRPFLFDPIVARRWRHIWFRGPERSHRFALNPYEYRMIRGEDFYRYVLDDLRRRENVVFVRSRVESIDDGDPDTGRPGTVHLDGGEYLTGTWIFDSLFFPGEFQVDTERYRFLKQHFLGWVLETDADVFDADAATMFDLRIEQNGAFRFMYILPASPRSALVEYTFFSSRLLSREEYEAGIVSYLEQYLPGVSYRIVEMEDGVIPMTDQPMPRRGGRSIMRIGSKGGRVKASTGFAFYRIQRDSERIVASLRKHGHPFDVPGPPRRYATFDGMLLSILDRTPDQGREIFVRLFERNPLPRIWRFLDEEAGIRENLQLMASVPWWPFIVAWFDVKFRRVRRRGVAPRSGGDR
ncbi:MAG: lycopene cyclase family protein [Alkalispirochaeta sp.]